MFWGVTIECIKNTKYYVMTLLLTIYMEYIYANNHVSLNIHMSSGIY